MGRVSLLATLRVYGGRVGSSDKGLSLSLSIFLSLSLSPPPSLPLARGSVTGGSLSLPRPPPLSRAAASLGGQKTAGLNGDCLLLPTLSRVSPLRSQEEQLVTRKPRP